MRACIGFGLSIACLAGQVTASAQANADSRYSTKESLGIFALYSNDSSHIILGTSQNRKIAGLGFSYTRRLLGNHSVEWAWEPEIRPLNFIREPWLDRTITVDQAVGVFPGNVGRYQGQGSSDCVSGTQTITVIVNQKLGDFYTETISQRCYSTWTYAGGLSPLGQRVSFAKNHRLQPYVIGNAGLLVAPHDIPSPLSNRFNFTFEMGAGFEWFRDHHHSWAIDYRLHHLSNDYTGYYNPGIDSQLFRVSYRMGR